MFRSHLSLPSGPPSGRVYLSMRVSVVQIRVMCVFVPKRFVSMPVRMGFGERSFVGMLVMFVMDMRVFVLQNVVEVLVVVALSQMEP